MKKILVPCDFSPPAQEAFKFAVRIASQSKGEIHVLYILDITFLRGNPTLSHSYAFNLSFLKDMEHQAETNFKTMWEKYSPLTLPVKFRHVIGSLQPDIEKYIRENEIDLVIMGTHGQTGSSWGSNTEKIIRHAPVPVFAIRTETGRAIKNIVVPVIPGELDTHFSAELKKLQAFFDATIHLLWINTPGIFKNDSEAHSDLQEYAADNNFSNYSLNVRSDYTVEDGIFRFARDTHADMIAIGIHTWKGFTRFFTEGIAEDIVRHVNLPIWTCPLK